MLVDIFTYAVFAYAGFWVLMGLAWGFEKLYCLTHPVRRPALPVKPDRLRIPRRVDLRDEEKVESWLWQHRVS